MNDERQRLFEELTPPPGGAERFARRLDDVARAPSVPRWRGLVFAGAACAAVALVIAVLLLREPDAPPPTVAAAPDIYDAPEFDRLLGRPARPMELSVTIGERTASVVEVETFNEKVRIYNVN